MGQQPSIPTDLSRELQVIGAGFSRTGTVSLSLALERLLQGPVMHSGTASLMREEAFVKSWISILSPTATPSHIASTLQTLHAGYVATTDNPAILFTSELAQTFPNAVVICSTRDRESWWRSSQALNANTMLWWLDIVFLPVPTLRWFGQFRRGLGMRIEKIYQTKKEELDGRHLLDVHENYVRSVVPAERLYFYNVREGWEPLCKILGCPVPDEPFPRANDANAMQEFFEGVLKNAIIRWLVILATLVFLGFFCWITTGRGEEKWWLLL